jgi:hypothetical protein
MCELEMERLDAVHVAASAHKLKLDRFRSGTQPWPHPWVYIRLSSVHRGHCACNPVMENHKDFCWHVVPN